MVEGAKNYDLRVDTDPGFGSPDININTAMNSYTPTGTLPNAIYYWQVRTVRQNNEKSAWSEVKQFTLNLPVPVLLSPAIDESVPSAPTMCWDHLLAPSVAAPVLAAYRYKIEISKFPNFSNIYDSNTTEQTCFTPTKGYDNGTYYWRVAMLDGNNRQGDFNPSGRFNKQYPVVQLTYPGYGERVPATPIFEWRNFDGSLSYVPGAAQYKLEIYKDALHTISVEKITTENTHYKPYHTYVDQTEYYWRVAIVDGDGIVGPWTDATLILNSHPFHIAIPLVIR